MPTWAPRRSCLRVWLWLRALSRWSRLSHSRLMRAEAPCLREVSLQARHRALRCPARGPWGQEVLASLEARVGLVGPA